MCDMRRLNVRELHRHTDAVVDQVTQGEAVVILKRGTPVGKIGAGFPPEHWGWLKKFPQLSDDSGKFISEDRDRG
jgi:antitoxin (DNA-binding transcriptional repressor) of toxin-antitoxin stability system